MFGLLKVWNRIWGPTSISSAFLSALGEGPVVNISYRRQLVPGFGRAHDGFMHVLSSTRTLRSRGLLFPRCECISVWVPVRGLLQGSGFPPPFMPRKVLSRADFALCPSKILSAPGLFPHLCANLFLYLGSSWLCPLLLLPPSLSLDCFLFLAFAQLVFSLWNNLYLYFLV